MAEDIIQTPAENAESSEKRKGANVTNLKDGSDFYTGFSALHRGG